MGNLLDKFLKLEESKKAPDEKIIHDIQDEKIVPGEKAFVSEPKMKPKKTKICPTCNKRHKIFGEKTMNRHDLIQWFQDFVSENEKNLPLDWLRGQKLSFETVNEMRKKRE